MAKTRRLNRQELDPDEEEMMRHGEQRVGKKTVSKDIQCFG
jgi:hypothetical protein